MSAALWASGFVGLAILAYVVGVLAWHGNLTWAVQQRFGLVASANALLVPWAGAVFVLLGVAACRVWWRCRPGPALRLWGWQLLLNAAWAPAMFGLHSAGLGLAVIVSALFAGLANLRLFARIDWLAAAAMVPYLAWTLYATSLSAGCWWLG